jgi:hypothetical protein
MKYASEELQSTVDLVSAADPLRYAEGEQPDTEAALRVMLANVPVSRSRMAPRRRRGMTLAGIASGATVATVLAVNLAPGGGEVSNVLGRTGVLVSSARAAQIVARVQRQLTHFAANDIIEFKVVSHQTGPGQAFTWSQRQWESTSSPYRELVTFNSSNSSDSGFHNYSIGTTAQDIIQLYDPSRNTIYEPMAKPAWRLTPGAHAGTWTLTVPRAVLYTPLARGLPPALRGTVRLSISDAQARALRSGVKEVVYEHPYPHSTKKFSIFTRPRIGTYANVTGYGRPQRPASWVRGLKTRGLRVRLYGRSAIEITSKQDETTYWFSAATLYPLKSVTRFGKTLVTSRFEVYRVLSGAAASTSLLSLRRAHPTARIVIGEPSFYAAETRLGAS